MLEKLFAKERPAAQGDQEAIDGQTEESKHVNEAGA